VLASARLRELVLIHSTMPGVKLRVVELEVLVQLGRGEEPEFAFGTLNYVHLEPMLTGELAPNGFRGRELEWWLRVV
jgi:hypothetical protein